MAASLGVHERAYTMDADYGKETGRSSGSCHLDLHFRYAKNDRAHARYNNFSEPLFTQAIYGGRPRSIKNSRASRVFAYPAERFIRYRRRFVSH